MALLRQSRRRFSTSRSLDVLRDYSTTRASSRGHARIDRSSFSTSRTALAAATLTKRTPFATTLRPNITGGALNRTAGGYSLGTGRIGGARYFSHSPAAPAEVIQNVSQAVRAFCLSGHKAHYAGVNGQGEKCFDAVSIIKHENKHKFMHSANSAPGSFVEFTISPTITAIAPSKTGNGHRSCQSSEVTLTSEGLLDVLSKDFSRALRDFAAIMDDLNRLTALGDLRISHPKPTSLRVHFPGCDAKTVETLCNESGVMRGTVVQDDDFDSCAGIDFALLFPFAPAGTISDLDSRSVYPSEHMACVNSIKEDIDWRKMMQSDASLRSRVSDNDSLFDALSYASNRWPMTLESPERSGSWHGHSQNSDIASSNGQFQSQDFEGVYRFIELCDSARR